VAVPQIDSLTPSELMDLGQTFVLEIRAVETGRQEIVDDYAQWVKNYEGDVKPAESEKPWEGASDGHIPKTATDVDIAFARFMGAVFGQTPQAMLRPLSAEWVTFARETQKLSEWVEETQIPLYALYSQTFMILAKFGTVVIYNPWENRPVKFQTMNAEGQMVPVEDDLLNRPNPRVLHPEDYLQPIHSMDPQTAPWCGYRYKLRLPELRLWKNSGFFTEDAAEQLETFFSGQSQEGAPQVLIPTGQNTVNTVQKAREDAAGLSRPKASDEVDMVHIFARVDIDGDGIEEEINFHLHPATGIIARLAYSHYRHRRRPFIDFHYMRRDGIFYSIGVPEMLQDVQRNVDVTFRQIQDNNTFKNTQTIKAKEGGTIQPDERWHPARIWFVREMDDLEVFRLGDSNFNTSMTDLQLLMDAGDRRTGLPDAAAGGTQDNRATATATLAILQEASRRIDLVIGGIREGLSEFWMQVLELYAQFSPILEFPYQEDQTDLLVDGDEDMATREAPTLLRWHFKGEEAFRRRVMIKPTMSTASLNKSVLRQEMGILHDRLVAYNTQQITFLNYYLQAVDPTLKAYLRQTMDASHLVMERELETFEFAKDTQNLLPKPGGILDDISPVQAPLADVGKGSGSGSGSTPGVGSPQGLLPNPGAGYSPSTAPGRPINGGLPAPATPNPAGAS